MTQNEMESLFEKGRLCLKTIEQEKRNLDQIIIAIVERKGTVTFNDETGFPLFHYSDKKRCEYIIGARVRKNEGGKRILEFNCDTDIYGNPCDDLWFSSDCNSNGFDREHFLELLEEC